MFKFSQKSASKTSYCHLITNQKECEGDEFDFLSHYAKKDPNGITERKMMEIGWKTLSSFDEKIESYRFEMTPGKKYSLSSSFRYNNIEEKVTGVILSFDAQTNSHLSFHVLSCDKK